ncbi:glycosyl hydrolase family 18 protein [Cohnella soli]|uniref:chitinase n=1 Tax=Cohnella soli TaxID=425005 RepID=A0ABW0HQV6_9BACL
MLRLRTRLGVVIVLILAALIFYPTQNGHADNEIKVAYDGDAIRFTNPPVSINGTTYAQARPLLQSLGLTINWLSSGKFSIHKSGLTIDMAAGSATAYVNGKSQTLAFPPLLRDSTLFLPLRPIASLLQITVQWDASARLVALSSLQGEDGVAVQSAYKVIGYYPSWALYQKYDSSKLATAGLTHINYAFANIENGQISLGDADADKANFAALRKLKAANPKLKTLISVGGWTWSGRFSDAAASIYARNLFADSVVAFIRQHGFDGVDLDWEYPVSGGLAGNKHRPEDKRNFTLLLQTLRDKLNAAGTKDGRTYLLTIAVGAAQENVGNIEAKNVAGIVDWINLMTYDYHGDWEKKSGHNAPLYGDSADPISAQENIDFTVQAYKNDGVPAAKLVMGVPFYGRSWTGCGTADHGQYSSCSGSTDGTLGSGSYSYATLVKQNWAGGGNGYTRYWNERTKTPWLYSAANGGTFIAYEDPESIGYKAEYVKRNKLGGVMAWELSQDSGLTLLTKLVQNL